MPSYNTPQTSRHLAMQQTGFYDGSQGYGAGQEGAIFKGLTPEQQAQVTQLAGQIGSAATAPALQEPLHAFEKQGLTGLSNTGATAGSAQLEQILSQIMGATDGSGGLLGQASTATAAGSAPITQEQIQGVANPWADGLKQNLSKTAEKIRAQISAGEGNRGARSFGDTYTGIQHGMLNDKVVEGENTINYQTFQDALGQLNTERGRSMQAGGQYGSLAGTQLSGMNAGANIAQGVRGNSIEDFVNQIRSGSEIRGYNQDINDIMRQDLLGEAGHDQDISSQLLQMLKQYESGGSYYTPGKVSTLSQVGAGLGALGGAVSGFGGLGGGAASGGNAGTYFGG